MQTLRQFTKKIKALKRDGYIMLYKYKVGDDFRYEKIGNKTIQITIKNRVYSEQHKKYHYYSDKKINSIFKTLIKTSGIITIKSPVNKELGYDDSLRWLYHHYKFGDSNNANVVLLNGYGRIIAIQYNGLEKTDYLYAKGVEIIPDYIVLNNCKKLQGKYRVLDYNKIETYLKTLFNNKILGN